MIEPGFKAPCYGCEERKPGGKDCKPCHASCWKYIAYWNANRARNDEKIKEQDIDSLFAERVKKAIKRRKQLRGKKH